MLAIFFKLLKWLGEEILPIVQCYRVELMLNKKIEARESMVDLPNDVLPFMELSLADIQTSHTMELSRRQQIQTKAQTNVTAITLATTFVFSVIGLRGKSTSDADDPVWIIRILLAAGVLSFLMSGYSSIRALRIARLSDLWLQYRPVGVAATEEMTKEILLRMIGVNQLGTLIMSNYASASYTHVRNGLVILALILLIAIFYTGNAW